MNTSNFIQTTFLDAFKGVSKEVWFISIIQLVNRSGMMVLPFLSLYLTGELEWTLGRAAMAGLSFGAGGLLSALIGGWMVDRFPVFKIMFFSLVVGGLCYITLTWITEFYYFIIWLFITTTVVDMLRPAAMAAVSNYSTKTNLARGISVLRLAINLGMAIGPAIGGLLIESVGYSIIFIIEGATCIAGGLLVVYFFRNDFDQKMNTENEGTDLVEKMITIKSPSAYFDIKYLLFLFFNFCMLCMFFQVLYTIPLFFRNVYLLSESGIGLFFMINGLLIFVTELPIIYALEKRSLSYRPMVWGILLIGLSFIFLIIDLPFIWLSIILFNFILSMGEIINFPFISTISILRASGNNKGSYIGSMATMFSLAFMLAPIIFMPYIDTLGFDMIWSIAMIVCILAAVGLHFLRPYFNKDIQ